jgi:hypothetical protein
VDDLTLAQRQAAGEEIAREHAALKAKLGREPNERERQAVIEAAYRKAGLTVQDNAKISARGAVELARWSKEGSQYLLRSDGALLSNLGYGWKTFRKFKAETPREKWVAICDQWLRSKGFARANTAPVKNIFWKDIQKGARVELRGKPGSRYYVSGGKTVFWGGQDSSEAQAWLDAAVKRSATAKKNPILMTVAGAANPSKKTKRRVKAAAKRVGMGALGGVGSAAGALAAAPLLRKLVGANPTTKTFKAGDRVMFAREFLQSTGQITGKVPFAVGTVKSVKPFGHTSKTALVAVDWDGSGPGRVSSANLVLESELHLESRNPQIKQYAVFRTTARHPARPGGEWTAVQITRHGQSEEIKRGAYTLRPVYGVIAKSVREAVAIGKSRFSAGENPVGRKGTVRMAEADRADEVKAIAQYRDHARKTGCPQAKRAFRHIQGEERHHLKELDALLKHLHRGNVQPNPHIVIDPAEDRVWSIFKGDRPDSTFTLAYERAAAAAREKGRDFYIVAHPYVPPGWQRGTLISKLFYHQGPFIAVQPDGSTRNMGRSNPGRPHKNPMGSETVIAGRRWKIYDAYPSREAAEQYAKEINDAQGPFIEAYPTDARVFDLGPGDRLRYAVYVARRVGTNPLTSEEATSLVRQGEAYARYSKTIPSPSREIMAGKALGVAEAALNLLKPGLPHMPVIAGRQRVERIVRGTMENPAASEYWLVTRDGKELVRFRTEQGAWKWLHDHQSSSVNHAVMHEGYDIVLEKSGKRVLSYSRRIGVKANPLTRGEVAKAMAYAHKIKKDSAGLAQAGRPRGAAYEKGRAHGWAEAADVFAGKKAEAAAGRLSRRILSNTAALAPAPSRFTMARWASRGGKHWLELYLTDTGWSYRTDGGGGYIGRRDMTDEQVQAAVQRQIKAYKWSGINLIKQNPAPSRGKFFRERVAPPAAFQRGSLRTVTTGSGHKVVVGRPLGKATTRAQSILHPKTLVEARKLQARGVKPVVGTGPRKARPVSKVAANPPRRRITMTLNEYMQWAQKNRQPGVIADLQKKFGEYEKWTHGTRAHKVTLDFVPHSSVRGTMTMYDMGRQPESLYAMPKGTKRTGLWRHKWEKWPRMMGDSQRGLILTKLVKGNKITDFLHG